MKIHKILYSIAVLLIMGLFTQCELDEIPQDALTSEQITTTSDG